MDKLAVIDMVGNASSYYSLVVGVAKRARQIAADAEESKAVLTKKPVQIAIEEYNGGKYKIVSPE